jgi:hypothetical protein
MAESTLVFSCIQPIYNISKVLGLFPVTFNGNEFKCNRNLIIYSFIFISINHIINVVLCIRSQKDLFIKTIDIDLFINFIGVLISLACLIQNYIFCFYATKNLPKVLNLLEKTSKKLKVRNFRYIMWKFVVLLSVFYTTTIVTLYYNMLNNPFNTTSKEIQEIFLQLLWFLANIFKYISITVLEIQFCVLCSIVRYLFHAINLELRSYTDTGRVTNKRMRELQDCYNNLVQITVYINDVYGMCNLLNMVMLNVFIQSDVYELVLYIYDKITHKQTHEFNLLFVAWTLTDVYKCVLYFVETGNAVAEVSKLLLF